MIHQRGHFAMAAQTVLLRDGLVKIGNANRFVEIAGGEGIAVSKSVQTFDGPVSNEILWSVTIVARGNALVAAVVPAVVDLAHHVTIRARGGVVGEVGITLRVHEGKTAKAK